MPSQNKECGVVPKEGNVSCADLKLLSIAKKNPQALLSA